MYLLDSSAIIDIINTTGRGTKIVNEITDKKIFTTCFSVYEVIIGLKQKEVEKIKNLFEDIEILNFDYVQAKESAYIYKKLVEKGSIVDDTDIFIASISILNGLTLITTDKDFLRIPNIKIKLFE